MRNFKSEKIPRSLINSSSLKRHAAEKAELLTGDRKDIVGLVLRDVLELRHGAVRQTLTGQLTRADGDFAVGGLKRRLRVDSRVEQHENARDLVLFEHKIPQNRNARDTDDRAERNPFERKPRREQHDDRDHEILDRHARVARGHHDRAHHEERVQRDDRQAAQVADVVPDLGDMRRDGENENQLAELARLKARHAQIEPRALAVDLHAERREQQQLKADVHDNEVFPPVPQPLQVDKAHQHEGAEADQDGRALHIQIFCRAVVLDRDRIERGGVDERHAVAGADKGDDRQIQIGVFQIMRHRFEKVHADPPFPCSCYSIRKYNIRLYHTTMTHIFRD